LQIVEEMCDKSIDPFVGTCRVDDTLSSEVEPPQAQGVVRTLLQWQLTFSF
jgi:hypothetical protein